MRDIIQDVDSWLEEGKPLALATVIETWGSAPRGVGAKMFITSSGRISGSVSGGCVEGAVLETGLAVLNSGQPELLHFGVSDDVAWDVGLACGGTIEVFVEKVDPVMEKFIHDLSGANQPFAIATVIGGPNHWLGNKIVAQRGGRIFGKVDNALEGSLAAVARSGLAWGESQRLRLDLPDMKENPVEVFVEVIHPTPTLVMVGGVHIAIVLTSIAKTLGYQTIVIDPRKAFGNQERFAHVDRLIQAWPNDAFKEIELTPSTAIAILTHDPKIDDPALLNVLASPAFYVGALGSRKTHASRRRRLVDAGLSDERINRINAPIGIDIGASSPEEIAVSIMAEIVAARHVS
ncbi:MAG: XdhC family protein [Candidatus Promineifilaceae bacterium]